MANVFKAVDVNDERGVRTMTPAKPMLARSEKLMLLPEVNDFPDVYPEPDLLQDLK